MPLRKLPQLWLSLDGSGTLQEQIYRALRARIVTGELAPGTRLPSTRALARDLDVSRTTTQATFDQLIAEGYIEARRGSGSFVASEIPDDRMRARRREPRTQSVGVRWSKYAQRIAKADLGSPFEQIRHRRPVPLELLYGIPDPRLIPHDDWRRAVSTRASAMSVRSIAYGPPEGSKSLRITISEYLLRARGIDCDVEDIVIVTGAQQGLQLIVRMLCDPGSAALIEHPWYPGARNAIVAEGVRVVPGPIDEHGLDIESVDARELAACRVAYVTPAHQFPTGAVMSFPRRQQLLAWAERAGAFVFEDDYDSEFRYRGRPIESLRSLDSAGRVIYAGTFSKTLFPSLRIGFVVLPHELRALMRSVRWLAGWSNPSLEQGALADLIRDGRYERHLRRTRVAYARRRAALLEALERYCGDRVSVTGDAAGLHVLAWLDAAPRGGVEGLIERARDNGVGIYSVANCFAGGEPQRDGLVLGYSLLDPDELDRAIRVVADCW